MWVPIEARRECHIPWVWWLSPWQIVVSVPIQIKVLLASKLHLLTPPHKQYFTPLYQEVPTFLVRSPQWVSWARLAEVSGKSPDAVRCCARGHMLLQLPALKPDSPGSVPWIESSPMCAWGHQVPIIPLPSLRLVAQLLLTILSPHPPRPSMLASSQMNQPLLFLFSKWFFFPRSIQTKLSN